MEGLSKGITSLILGSLSCDPPRGGTRFCYPAKSGPESAPVRSSDRPSVEDRFALATYNDRKSRNASGTGVRLADNGRSQTAGGVETGAPGGEGGAAVWENRAC